MALVPHWRDNIKPWKPFWRPFGEIGSFTRSVSQSVNSHGQVRRYCDPFKVTLLTKNVRTFLLLSTLFLFIAAFFPLAPCYKMERDGHVIYCGVTLKDALLDYNLLFAFFRRFHCFESCYFHSLFTYHASWTEGCNQDVRSASVVR